MTTERSAPLPAGLALKSLTDCPQCGSLCLGPVILPCRDVICRRCLNDLLYKWLGPTVPCQQCGQDLDLSSEGRVTISEIVQKLGRDPILETLVRKELDKAVDIPCLHCPDERATKVCLDCQEYYCDVCSGKHLKTRIARDHLLHQLSQASSVAGDATATPNPGSSSSESGRDHDLDTQSRDASDGTDEWNQWVDGQVNLLRQASRENAQVKNVLLDILSLGKQLMDRLDQEEQQDVNPLIIPHPVDTGTYVIRTATDSEVITDEETQSFHR